MKRIIETRKGRFVVKYYETWNELIIDANFYKLKLGVSIFKISEITEEEASDIVVKCEFTPTYKVELINRLKSQGIEITNNTYIFKL